jgi:ribose transport system ATP-binding protein
LAWKSAALARRDDVRFVCGRGGLGGVLGRVDGKRASIANALRLAQVVKSVTAPDIFRPSPVTALIELNRVSKAFGPTLALREVSFSVRAGEVHAVLGENGAGKSTLIKILAGVHAHYTGELRIDGSLVRLHGPADAAARGVATMHQELSQVPSMSVLDNLLLGSEPGPLLGALNRRRRLEAAQRMLREAGIQIDPHAAIESVPLSVRQLLELAKALARRARVVIMDEPTSALTDAEAQLLLERVEGLKQRGCGVVYVSHRMEEIERIADRLSVLRDGACVATRPASEVSRHELVRLMLGRTLAQPEPTAAPVRGPAALELSGLTLRDPRRPGRFQLHGVSLQLHQGEIVGLAGRRGSGKSELLHAVFGSAGPIAGEMLLAGAPYDVRSPVHSCAAGVVLLANDRAASVLPELSTRANISLSALRRFTRAGWVRRAEEQTAVNEQAERVRLMPSRLPLLARQLSGGNQQKAALARCLLARPRVLLLDQPTRGIDVGTKAEIYEIIRELARAGVAVLLIASEMEELLLLCQRVLVLDAGRLACTLGPGQLSRERILAAEMTRTPALLGAEPT